MSKKIKKSEKEDFEHISLEQATEYLKKEGEWETIRTMDRDTVIKWAEFLMVREEKKKYE